MPLASIRLNKHLPCSCGHRPTDAAYGHDKPTRWPPSSRSSSAANPVEPLGEPPSSTMSESRPRPPKRFALESTDSARRQPARWESNHVLCLQLLISCHAAHAGSLAISRSSSTRTCAGRLHSCNEEPYRRPPRDPRRRVDTSLSSSDDYAKVECPGIHFIYH